MTENRPKWLRWLVPAAAIVATTAGAAALTTAGADAAPRLPARTAAQLLVDLQTARVDGLSGMVAQRADLGLPSLPGLTGGGSSSDLSSLVAGTHTLRVWYSGPGSARVALLGTLGESDFITNGRDVWVWNSRDNTAVHSVRPEGTAPARKPDLTSVPKTPQEAADAALAAIDPTTVVTTAGPTKVAGRSAYELLLAPRDKASRIGQVTIAIDAERHVPLRVRVFARGAAEPAVEVAFTQVSFNRPGAEQFAFNPPPGAKVTDESAADLQKKADSAAKDLTAKDQAGKAGGEPVVLGDGWTSVLAAKLPAPTKDDQAAPPKDGQPNTIRPNTAAPKGPLGTANLLGLVGRLPAVSGSWGSGHLLTGALFSVLLTDDGRVFAGAVDPDRLYAAAADPKASAAALSAPAGK
ncbi:LolA family protein [Hamadaea tsunoensis]|uniref:LolA family protein n=1 Tax=Hamadaea tsunoensis TaxID=53368 RepID=UPI0004028FC8|nr:hypothetical protein [Hamadaea tsunoensis]